MKQSKQKQPKASILDPHKKSGILSSNPELKQAYKYLGDVRGGMLLLAQSQSELVAEHADLNAKKLSYEALAPSHPEASLLSFMLKDIRARVSVLESLKELSENIVDGIEELISEHPSQEEELGKQVHRINHAEPTLEHIVLESRQYSKDEVSTAFSNQAPKINPPLRLPRQPNSEVEVPEQLTSKWKECAFEETLKAAIRVLTSERGFASDAAMYLVMWPKSSFTEAQARLEAQNLLSGVLLAQLSNMRRSQSKQIRKDRAERLSFVE